MYQHWKSKVDIMQKGPEPLPRCDQCRMRMPAARLFKQIQTYKCNKATERQLRRIEVEMASRCVEMNFNI